MAKKSVVECICDRCERVWYEDADAKDVVPNTCKIDLVVGIKDTDMSSVFVEYALLCDTCVKALYNYVANITRYNPAKDIAKEKATPSPSPKKTKS